MGLGYVGLYKYNERFCLKVSSTATSSTKMMVSGDTSVKMARQFGTFLTITITSTVPAAQLTRRNAFDVGPN